MYLHWNKEKIVCNKIIINELSTLFPIFSMKPPNPQKGERAYTTTRDFEREEVAVRSSNMLQSWHMEAISLKICIQLTRISTMNSLTRHKVGGDMMV